VVVKDTKKDIPKELIFDLESGELKPAGEN
jgi:hypothetical protein